MENKKEETKEKQQPKQTCELCNFPYPNTLVTTDTTFLLCPNHLLDLVMLNLPAKEARKLMKKHGTEEFYLHDDFYDEKGHALQPVTG